MQRKYTRIYYSIFIKFVNREGFQIEIHVAFCFFSLFRLLLETSPSYATLTMRCLSHESKFAPCLLYELR